MPPLILDSPRALRELAGNELGVSDWLRLTQERIDQFANATEDHQWIHVDRERASRESPYGDTIAHGFLTLSLAGYLLTQVVDVRGARLAVNYGLNRVRFPAPVRADAEIRARVALQSAKELADSVEALFLITVEARGQAKPCCVAEWICRYFF